MDSPTSSALSDDDLFREQRRPFGYETIETLPVQHSTIPTQPLTRIRDSPELESVGLRPIGLSQAIQSQYGSSLPPVPESPIQHLTQPTQIIERSPMMDLSSPPPSKPVVQVTASSPITGPPTRRPTGILANAMAPPGTAFRRPVPPVEKPKPAPWPVLVDDDTSESDREARERNSIKQKKFERKVQGFAYQPTLQGQTNSEALERNLKDLQLRREQEILVPTKVKPNTQLQGTQQVLPPKQPVSEQPQIQLKWVHERGQHGDNTRAQTKPSPSFQNGFANGTSATQALKRSADTMASAYGNVSKKMRQDEPSRAMPVTKPALQNKQLWQPRELNDIDDPNMRKKTQRLHGTLPSYTIGECWHALMLKNGQYDDAADHLLLMSEAKDKPGETPVIDLAGSEDELMPTPAMKKQTSHIMTSTQASQPPKKPTISIAKKWADIAPAPPKTVLNVFDTPPPQDPAVKKRTLMRGRKNRSPSPGMRNQVVKKSIVIEDDSDDGGDSGVYFERDTDVFGLRVLKYFNECTALDLSDITGFAKDITEHVLSFRPFKDWDAIKIIENANKKSKSRSAIPLGEKVWDKVYLMLESYEAVDWVVKECEEMSRPIARNMAKWGFDVHGKAQSGKTGLDLVSLEHMNGEVSKSHDSGIGTPVSDDGDIKAKKVFIPQPTSLNEGVQMKDYQVVGLNWLDVLFRHKTNGILADDMGLGKTLQTIAFIAHLAEVGIPGPHLIVVPSATLENWLQEFQRFAAGLVVKPYYGSIPEREEMRYQYELERDEKSINVLVTTYVIAKAKEDTKWLREFGFVCAIFDEGHQLKNPLSEVASKLTRIRTRFRLLLTGTPLQNNLGELMGLLKFLMPDIFKEKEDDLQAIFKQHVSTITEDTSSRQMLLSKQRIERARNMLTPFILRRKKWQVLRDLPKKERKVEYCEMTPEQEEIYNTWIAKAWDVRDRKLRGERVPADESANVLVRLRQAAIHPLLFRYFYTDKTLRKIAKTCPKIETFRESNPELIMQELVAYADFETHGLCAKHELLHSYLLDDDKWEVSGKVQALLKLLARFRTEGHRTLVFSQFVMVLDILERVLTSQEIKYLRLDGSTKVDERQDLIDLFNAENSEIPVFMLSTKAGGAGINLASANRVIVFDSGFNPQDDVQAENRAHRIGQTKDVEVWRLITKGTVEEQIYDMGLVKLKLDQEVAGEALDGPFNTADAASENQDQTGKKGASGGLTKTEQEGANVVEDLLFKKLEADGPNSPARARKDIPKLKKETSSTDHKKAERDKPAVKLKLKVPKIEESESDSTLDSPLTELSSLEEEMEEIVLSSRRKKSGSESQLTGRPKRNAAKQASQKSSSQLSNKEQSGSQRSRSGRLVRGRS